MAYMKDSTGKRLDRFPVQDSRTSRPSLSDQDARALATPNFKRIANQLLHVSQADLPSLYYPYVIKTDGLVKSPLAKYYLYYSTNHDDNMGGIALATFNEPGEPLVKRGVVFGGSAAAGTGGKQVETPAVLWNETADLIVYGTGLAATASGNTIAQVPGDILANGETVKLTAVGATGLTAGVVYYVVGATPTTFQLSRRRGGTASFISANSTVTVNIVGCFEMFYQVDYTGTAANNQRSCAAYSRDGISWTRYGAILNGNPAGAPHTGYIKPFRVGRRWCGYHLDTGGNYSQAAMSWSNDGFYWFTDPRPLLFEQTYSGEEGDFDSTFKVSWISPQPFEWNGRLWTLVTSTPFTTAGGSVANVRLGVAPLRSDLRSFAAPPVEVDLNEQLPNEALLSGGPTNLFLHDDGLLYGFYVASHTAGSTTAETLADQSIGLIRLELPV